MPLLRIHADASCPDAHPADGGTAGLCALRTLVVADVLLRTAALGGRQTVLGLALPDLPEERVKELMRDAALLNVHPPTVQVGVQDVTGALGGPADVHVVCPGAVPHAAPGAGRIDVGPVTAPPGALDDPPALRLALLGLAPGEPADLTSGDLGRAAATTARWRALVAAWAREPSRPMHAATVREARARFADGLDTRTALALLHRLEEAEEVPAGSRFETFAHLDRVLALELARDVGR
ncbi:hypothetical protein LO771_13985 [Streptacidiphilus sp. ASG 303]|uniref:hypothetical protein n=1 Tax=Streptacidiphilus sp. ASG 303 TaxID=2896847 RepID=UPI001E31D1F5|nr:hypothetical protein [Streptacidiphilus sp. ASG 303]MCD0483479.1 hypothetical protein [Streptacidiphilus sp. ASG 303]